MKPNVNQDAIDMVLGALASGHWLKGRELQRIYGVPPRLVRAVAEKTGKVISSQRGYKLTSCATDAELEAAHADLMSRSQHIIARAGRIANELSRRVDSQDSFPFP